MRRLFYVDALRALAIYLLIFWHLTEYYPLNSSYYSPLISIFDMPLFMFVSGYVTNAENFKLSSRLKILIPFFIIGIINTLVAGFTIQSFFTTLDKNGYWFLYVLVVFFVCMYGLRKSKINLYIGLIIFEVLFAILYVLVSKEVNYLLGIASMFLNWPFFSLGIISKRINLVEKISSRKLLTYILSFLFVSFLFIISTHVNGKVSSMFIDSIMAVFILAILVVFFYSLDTKYEISNNCHSIINKLGTEIGTSTLQIYTLHYFFLRLIRKLSIGEYLMANDLCWLELIISPVLAFVIVYLCIYTAKIIYKIHLGFIFGR
jgi:fucose 4-O-acetylase-like acetyltransferase